MEEVKQGSKIVEVYDIETLATCWTYIGLNIETQEISTFVIHESRNDLEAFKEHLKNVKGQIGFNNLAFDYPVIHDIMLGKISSAEEIYNKAQQIIDCPEEDRFSVQIAEWHMLISQLDLYALNHFNNGAKRTSLKDLEFWMQYPNVQDMPISHKEAIREDQISMVLEYNLNDVKATYAFYELCKPKIELRKMLGKEYGLKFTNTNDPAIGSNIFLDLLSKDMGIDKPILRKIRTFRKDIALKDVLVPHIKFAGAKFQSLLGNIKQTSIDSLNPKFENSVVYKGVKYDFGLGGLHSCCKPGVYCSNDEWVITDIDVNSYYPNLAINNGFHPAHLGKTFCKIYKQIYEQRAIAKKAGNKAVNEGLKLALNGTFGKAGDKNSYLYDMKFLFSITLNGQMLLAMLIEELIDTIDDIQVLQVNTDGVTIKYKQIYENIVKQICKDWEHLTKLELEYKEYSKMIIMDVNNYTAIDIKGGIKTKGLFEISKEAYKDTSFKIIPIALQEYFVNDIPIDTTIENHENIYDFCGRAKFKKDSYGEVRWIDFDENKQPYIRKQKQQKTTRYYISKSGYDFFKVFPEKNKEQVIHDGWKVEIFNKFEKRENYTIDYRYYYKECMKIIQVIENKQLILL